MSPQKNLLVRSDVLKTSRPWKALALVTVIVFLVLVHIALSPFYSPAEVALIDIATTLVFLAPLVVVTYILWDAFRLA